METDSKSRYAFLRGTGLSYDETIAEMEGKNHCHLCGRRWENHDDTTCPLENPNKSPLVSSNR